MADISDLYQKLKYKREELTLKVHLGTMEAKQEWRKLEMKWKEFADQANLQESTEEISEAMKLVGTELREAYERIRKAL